MSEKQTRILARELVRKLRGGEVIALRGELGTGKTTFVRGMAEALGVRERVKSPTFLLMTVYPVEKCDRAQLDEIGVGQIKNFVHVDCYRLNHANDLLDIGLDEYLGRKDTIVAIEWPERMPDVLPDKTITVAMEHRGNNERLLTISAKGGSAFGRDN